jgi:hypothetical protein
MVSESSRETVQRRAYEIYEQRGREDGHDWDDWLQAERELRGADSPRTGQESPRSTQRQRRGERAPERVA